jgi:hypothetical protein
MTHSPVSSQNDVSRFDRCHDFQRPRHSLHACFISRIYGESRISRLALPARASHAAVRRMRVSSRARMMLPRAVQRLRRRLCGEGAGTTGK